MWTPDTEDSPHLSEPQSWSGASHGLATALLACLLGTALQLQQSSLLSANDYLLGLLAGLLLLGLSLWARGPLWRRCWLGAWAAEGIFPMSNCGD